MKSNTELRFLLACLWLAPGLWAADGPGPVAGQTKPQIITEPQGQIVALGTTVSFTVEATGEGPITYRWRKGGITLCVNCGPTLVLSNTVAADFDLYSVVVANPHGSVVSRLVPLTFFSIERDPEGIALDLTGFAQPNYVYELRYVTAAAATNWIALTNFALPYSPYRFVDREAGTSQQRFYRAVLLPWY